MLRKTQLKQVIEQIELTGCVSRNWALRNFISRLGAIINILNTPEYGYNLKGKYIKTEYGKDYVYKNIKVELVPAYDIKPIKQEILL